MEQGGRTTTKKLRVLTLLAVPTLLAAALPSNAGARAPSHPRERPALKAVTKIVGSRTGSLSVLLPRQATITIAREHGPSPDATISGSGRYAGVVLVSEEWKGGLLHEDVFIANRWGLCESRGCDPGRDVIYDYRGLTRNRAGEAIIEAGSYELHILADDTPVEVMLRLHGAPKGTTTLRPDGPSTLDFGAPDMTVENDAAGSYVYGAGDDFYGGAVGFSSSVLYVEAADELNPFNGGICHIDSPSGPPGPAYGPQCYALTAAGLGEGFYLVNEQIDDREFALLPLVSYHNQGVKPPNLDGRRGLGAWVTTPYPLTSFRFMAFFVEAP